VTERTLVELKCKTCSGGFTSRMKAGKHPGFCSDACRDAAVKARSERYRTERRYERRRADRVELKCKTCSVGFTSPTKHVGRHSGFCSDACRDAAGKARSERYRTERRYERQADCVICGKPFSTISYDQRACGTECGDRLRLRSRQASLAIGDLFGDVTQNVSTSWL
jgi:predicted nucleic acid-binding Zn ribbon protein